MPLLIRLYLLFCPVFLKRVIEIIISLILAGLLLRMITVGVVLHHVLVLDVLLILDWHEAATHHLLVLRLVLPRGILEHHLGLHLWVHKHALWDHHILELAHVWDAAHLTHIHHSLWSGRRLLELATTMILGRKLRSPELMVSVRIATFFIVETFSVLLEMDAQLCLIVLTRFALAFIISASHRIIISPVLVVVAASGSSPALSLEVTTG